MKDKLYKAFLILLPFFIIKVDLIILQLYYNNIYGVDYAINFYSPESCFIGYSIFLLLVLIFKSFRTSNIFLHISSYILMTINGIKLFYMGEPIYVSDIKLLRGIGDVLQMTNNTSSDYLSRAYPVILIHTLFIVICLIILIKFKQENVRRRIAYLVPFIFLVIMSLPFKITSSFTNKFLYQPDEDYRSVTNNYHYNIVYGFSGGIYANMIHSRFIKPNDYSNKIIDNIHNYKSDSNTKDADYNIIFVLSESFFDITKVDDIEFNYDFLKDYHDLQKEGKLIEMISPVYGGRTSNVEFELFTSFNLSYYDNAFIPYLNLFNTDFPLENNIFNILHMNKYNSYIFIGTSDQLYNAKKVYESLGIKNIETVKHKEQEVKGFYISDHSVTDNIINFMDSNNELAFAFFETMQNHMPYTEKKYNKYTVSITNSNLDNNDEKTIISYAEGIHDSSIELKRLYDYIKSIDDKTIIIFIGDHLPYLTNNKGENIVDKLNYFNTDDILLNNYRRYNIEALILSNFDINYDDTKYLSPDLLVPYIFKTNGTKMNSYFNYLIDISKEVLPSYNRYVSMDKDGKLYNTNKLEDDMLEQYNIRNNYQYKVVSSRNSILDYIMIFSFYLIIYLIIYNDIKIIIKTVKKD